MFAFVIVASRSLFVVGEAAGGITPGLHATTEGEFILEGPVAAVDFDGPIAEPRAAEARRPSTGSAGSREVSTRIPDGYVYWKTIRAKVTAYDPSRLSCGKYADGKTSIGESAWVLDGVAAYPKAIPHGTYVVIPGVGGRVVDDTGSAMRTSWRRYRRFHVDLRVMYPYQARRWGVKYMDVKLYRKAR